MRTGQTGENRQRVAGVSSRDSLCLGSGCTGGGAAAMDILKEEGSLFDMVSPYHESAMFAGSRFACVSELPGGVLSVIFPFYLRSQACSF